MSDKIVNQVLLKSGTLGKKVEKTTLHAMECGALQSIPTEYEFVEQAGVKFLVRILTNLVRKEQAKQQKDFNPFLPYDEDLFVADISPTHLCLLNKYNVVDRHLLIVTREFEEQESLLTWEDFQAMWVALAEIDGLVFYNAGTSAGASQRHKHLQIVPLPLAPNSEKIPIAPMVASTVFAGNVGKIPSGFKNAIAQFNFDINSPSAAAQHTLELYHSLLDAVDLSIRRSPAYNLLATREWMLVIPRTQECFESISVNSLGFAGAMLIKNHQQMQMLKNFGPMNILKKVAVKDSD